MTRKAYTVTDTVTVTVTVIVIVTETITLTVTVAVTVMTCDSSFKVFHASLVGPPPNKKETLVILKAE